MKLVVLLSWALCVPADILHDSFRIIACCETDGMDMMTLDGEEAWYADFIHHTGVDALPDFVRHPSFEGLYEQAVDEQHLCKDNLQKIRRGMKDVPDAFDPPHILIYAVHDVESGENNTLVCHVSGFFPAPVRVYWTKNGQNMTEEPSISLPFPNKDSTFTQISRLDFVPQPGDIYSCSVDHVSLKEPLTRIWDVETTQPGVGPAVFCGLGLTVGLFGVALGTFFLIKGNECS